MIGRRKKQQIQRTPQIVRDKQATFQYSSNRSQTERTRDRGHDPEVAHMESKQRIIRYLYILALVLGLISAGFLSVLRTEPTLVITNDQTSLRGDDAYARSAAQVADSGIRGYTKLTLDRQKISQELQRQFPEITAVDVQTPVFASRAKVSITLAKPVALLNATSGDYLLDDRGVALFDAEKVRPTGLNTSKLLKIDDQSNTPIEIGKPALTSVQIAYITEVAHQGQAKQQPVESFSLIAGGGELHVRYQGIPYYVKYNFYEDARKSVGTFLATKEHIEGSNVKPVEYIDVRVPERAYIK